MKMNFKAFVVLALIVSVVVVSGCAQQAPAGNATATSTAKPAATQITSKEDAGKTVVDTSKDIKKISDTLADIDKTLAGTK